MITRERLIALPNGSALSSRTLSAEQRRVIEFHGYALERREGQAHIWHRILSPGSTMNAQDPGWPAGLEHALDARSDDDEG